MIDKFFINGEIYKDGQILKLNVGTLGGKIIYLGNEKPNAKQIIDCQGLTILPGIIDTQVHFRDPGANHKEDLQTGSRAAALGGITTFFDMPNTSPSTTNKDELRHKIQLAQNKCITNYGFFIGATEDNHNEIKRVIGMEGLCGVKIFLGSSTGDLLLENKQVIQKMFEEIPIMFSIHSEDEQIMRENKAQLVNPTLMDHFKWRSKESALSSTKKIIDIAKSANKKIHVLHISTAEEVDYLIKNKEHATFEITPQHLHLHAPDCYNDLGSLAQMNPPIREKYHQDRLWSAIKNNEVSILGSDHAPHTREEKQRPYPESPSGIPGVQTIFPLMLNAALSEKLSINQLIKYMVENPVNVFKIKNKGEITEDYDADLTIVDLKASSTITNEKMQSKVGWTPFDGMKLKGKVAMTIVRGTIVMRGGEICATPEKSTKGPISVYF